MKARPDKGPIMVLAHDIIPGAPEMTLWTVE